MVEKIRKVMVVIASPEPENDKRSNIVTDISKTFIENCLALGLDVDVLDLYQDTEFNPIENLVDKDTKVMEYQIRLKKAQLLVFFHPIWWQTVPAVLKGYIDKVFLPGFAFRKYNGVPIGLLDNKKSLVFAFTDKPLWQVRYVYGNVINNFWKKGILEYSGIKDNQVYLFGEFRSATEKTIQKWHKKTEDIVKKLNYNKPDIIDLF